MRAAASFEACVVSKSAEMGITFGSRLFSNSADLRSLAGAACLPSRFEDEALAIT